MQGYGDPDPIGIRFHQVGGSYGSSAKETEPNPEVIASLKNLDKEVLATSEALGALFVRLQPLLRENYPGKEPGEKNPPPPHKCRISNDIDSASIQIRGMAMNIGNVLERLGL